jgi:hypothetical protein
VGWEKAFALREKVKPDYRYFAEARMLAALEFACIFTTGAFALIFP